MAVEEKVIHPRPTVRERLKSGIWSSLKANPNLSKTMCSCVEPQELLVLMEVFGRDANLDVSALLQSYFVTLLVG